MVTHMDCASKQWHFQVFRRTSVVTPEIKTRGMQKQVDVSILQPLGLAVVIDDTKHTSCYSLAGLSSICLLQSALPSSTLLSVQIRFQAETKFLGSLYSNNKQAKSRARPALQRSRQVSATALGCTAGVCSRFPTDV